MVELKEDGTLVHENETLGILEGFVFKPFATTETLAQAGVPDFLNMEFEKRIDGLLNLGDTALRFGKDLSIQAEGNTIARLRKSDHILTPHIELVIDESIQGLSLARLGLHIESWIKRHINIPLESLFKLHEATDLSETATVFKNALIDHLGCCERRKLEEQIKALTPEDRTALRKYGVRFAQYTVFIREILKPAAINIKLVLNGLFKDKLELLPYPTAGMVAIAHNPGLDKSYYSLCGFRVCDKIAVRIDMIEKLVDTLRPLAEKTEANPKGEFTVDAQMMSLIGRSGEEFEMVLKSLGYRFRIEQQAKPIAPVQDEAKTDESETPAENTGISESTAIPEPVSETETTTDSVPESELIEVKIWFKAPPPALVKREAVTPRAKPEESGDKSHSKGHFLRSKKPQDKSHAKTGEVIPRQAKRDDVKKEKDMGHKKSFDKKKSEKPEEKKNKALKGQFQRRSR